MPTQSLLIEYEQIMKTTLKKSTKRVSGREQQILRLIADELTAKEIGQELFISAHTVISHRKNLMTKLHVRSIAGLVRRGFEIGLLNA